MIADIPKHSLLDIITIILPALQEGGDSLSDIILAELMESADKLALLLLDGVALKQDDKEILKEHRTMVGSNYFNTSPRIRHILFSLATKSTPYDKASKEYSDLSALLYAYALLTFASNKSRDSKERKHSFVYCLVPALLSTHLSGSNVFLASFCELALTVNNHTDPYTFLKTRTSISIVQTSMLLLPNSYAPNRYTTTVPPSVTICMELLSSCWKNVISIQERHSSRLNHFAPAELFEYTMSFIPAPSPQALKLLLDTYIGWSLIDSKSSSNETLLSFCLSFYSETAKRSFQEMGDNSSFSCLLQFLVPTIITAHYSFPHDILLVTLRNFTSSLSCISTLILSSFSNDEDSNNFLKSIMYCHNNIAPIFVNSLLIIEDVETAVPQLIYGIVLYLLYALLVWEDVSNPEIMSLDVSILQSYTHLHVRAFSNRYITELYSQITRFYIWIWRVKIVANDAYQLIDIDLPRAYDPNIICVDELNAREIYSRWFERLPILDDFIALKSSECPKDINRNELDLLGGAQLGLLVLRRSLENTLQSSMPSFKVYVQKTRALTRRNVALLDHLIRISN